MQDSGKNQQGFALIAVLMLVSLVAALLSAHYLLTRADLSTTDSAMDRTRGFYAAEAGLNLRAQQIREEFEGYNRPAGSPPPDLPGQLPCVPGATGSGDFACRAYSFSDRDVRTYVTEDPANPVAILIPPGEAFQNLNAQEYRYGVSSLAVNPDGRPEAILEMRFKSRLVPLFQFAVFYNKDLEINPGPPMTLGGAVHANGDIYLGADESLTIDGQVTVARGVGGFGGRLFNGRKYDDCCSTNNVHIHDGSSEPALPFTPTERHLVTQAQQAAWDGWIQSGLEALTVPEPEEMDASPGRVYWDKADLRIVLDLDAPADQQVGVHNVDGTRSAALSDTVAGCSGGAPGDLAVGQSSSALKDHREGRWMQMLEVDMQALMNCIQASPAVMGNRGLDDSTEGGLVWYFGVEGADTPVGNVNDFGVRVHNGAELASSTPGAPEIQGLTVVTNQAVYIQGDYNSDSDNWKPAAFLADSLNILSNNWVDTKSGPTSPIDRVAWDTTVKAGFLAGTDSTGDVELSPLSGGDKTIYNGGLENYPRLHENWDTKTLTYRGSFISLGVPRHVDGDWDDDVYKPPVRAWSYETRFSDAANLPPLSPRFVYLSQELFVREFDY